MHGCKFHSIFIGQKFNFIDYENVMKLQWIHIFIAVKINETLKIYWVYQWNLMKTFNLFHSIFIGRLPVVKISVIKLFMFFSQFSLLFAQTEILLSLTNTNFDLAKIQHTCKAFKGDYQCQFWCKSMQDLQSYSWLFMQKIKPLTSLQGKRLAKSSYRRYVKHLKGALW